MTDKERKYCEKRYSHLNLYFPHGRGWDNLTLIAALELDSKWPDWMPNWLKRLNNRYHIYQYGNDVINRLLYANKGRSVVGITKFYYSKLRKLVPFIKDYPRFLQIKEKYGTLRLYGAGDLKIVLERLSYLTCEGCGSTHEIGHTVGWVKTICKKCMLEKNNDLSNWTPYETN
jgi:hypothetical protein